MIIDEIDLTKSRPYKDFGKAFYLSADEKQAREMAKFKVLTGGGSAEISVFEFDELSLDDLKVKRFEEYTEEWAEFVYNNRDERQDFQHDYDLVYGPIANDTVGVQIRDLRERKISLTEFLKNLHYYIRYHFSICFLHTFGHFKIKESMNVTRAEFRYLKETLSKDLITMLMERKGMSMDEAFRCYYESTTFQKIANPETGLFFQSPDYVYSYLEEEMNI